MNEELEEFKRVFEQAITPIIFYADPDTLELANSRWDIKHWRADKCLTVVKILKRTNN